MDEEPAFGGTGYDTSLDSGLRGTGRHSGVTAPPMWTGLPGLIERNPHSTPKRV